ncbi:hypothetical protein [Rhizobium etli]|uniref:hypothetical protein n=1 Tax=Rhizobium etli TaxID=29449 RepID=UPI001641BB0D|nr:hypothetical protein [Rhizobium sp. IE4771]
MSFVKSEGNEFGVVFHLCANISYCRRKGSSVRAAAMRGIGGHQSPYQTHAELHRTPVLPFSSLGVQSQREQLMQTSRTSTP